MGDLLDKTFPFGSTLWETCLIKRLFWQYTMGDLLERIQASVEELEAQLQTIHACEVNGYWRLLDFDYEMKLLGHITQLVDSESWSFSKVPLSVSLEELGRLEPQ
eukprot:XP_014003249.1 PREDICTED: sister chromatid cohesion protein DCC1-like [Salmo salar]